MKVILNQTVPKVGKEGQVVTVANGYARNFLFPRKLAIVADKKQIQAMERRQVKLDTKLAETKSEAEAIKEKLHGQTVKLEGKVGKDSTKLFGAITAQDVADAIKSQLKVDVEKKRVGVLEPIKRLGRHPIDIDLHRDVDATVTVHVFDPNAPEDEVVVTETAEGKANATAETVEVKVEAKVEADPEPDVTPVEA